MVSRVIRPGREREFELWVEEADGAAKTFPGHIGSVRLQDPGGVNHLVYQFDSQEHLRAWENSAERRSLVSEADAFSEQRRQVATGLDAWFAVPGQATSPKWKTFVVTWIAVYPTLLLVYYGLNMIAEGLWQPLKLAISSLLLTASLTWLILPRITRSLRPWLLKGSPGSKPRETSGSG